MLIKLHYGALAMTNGHIAIEQLLPLIVSLKQYKHRNEKKDVERKLIVWWLYVEKIYGLRTWIA